MIPATANEVIDIDLRTRSRGRGPSALAADAPHPTPLLGSAGYERLPAGTVAELDRAAGNWISQLRVVLINAAHSAWRVLTSAMLAHVAWHECAHAGAVARATSDDVAAAGERLRELVAGSSA